MSDNDVTPFTTEELSDGEISDLSLPDQICYAIYNGGHRPAEIVEVTTFGSEWTTDMLEDMLDEGTVIEGHDDNGLFYTLPGEHQQQGLDDERREEIHEEALIEYRSGATIGDERDMELKMADQTDAPAKASITDRPTDDTVSGPEATDDDVSAARSENGGRLPVDRGYDWDAEKLDPDTVHEYVEAESEKTDITNEIEERRKTGKLPHFCISGPTGCGKTSLGEDIAVGMDAACFIVNCHDGLRPNNLLGMPTYVGDETRWVDGPVTKALLASQERPVVLIFDEVNRTTSRTLGVVMSLLDHRCSVTLNARGGEVVQGDPENLVVFSTMNEGNGYMVNKIDRAQVRRLGNKYYTDYIGMYDVDEEVELLTERTPVSEDVAQSMVEAANDIRRKADGDSAIKMGVPTSSMIQWARTAWTYRDDDYDGGPLVKAGERAVLNPFYKGNDAEVDIVNTTFETHVSGMDVGEEFRDDTDDADDDGDSTTKATIDVSEDTWLMCENCGWYEQSEDADDEVVTTLECPKCGETLDPKEAGT